MQARDGLRTWVGLFSSRSLTLPIVQSEGRWGLCRLRISMKATYEGERDREMERERKIWVGNRKEVEEKDLEDEERSEGRNDKHRERESPKLTRQSGTVSRRQRRGTLTRGDVATQKFRKQWVLVLLGDSWCPAVPGLAQRKPEEATASLRLLSACGGLLGVERDGKHILVTKSIDLNNRLAVGSREDGDVKGGIQVSGFTVCAWCHLLKWEGIERLSCLRLDCAEFQILLRLPRACQAGDLTCGSGAWRRGLCSEVEMESC